MQAGISRVVGGARISLNHRHICSLRPAVVCAGLRAAADGTDAHAAPTITCIASNIPRGSQFLINFAYSGATYSGVQRQTSRKDGDVQHTQHENFDHTVQMAVEIGIMDLKPKPVFMFTQVASRTDAGVSALDNYMMVRLEHPDFPASDYDASHMEDSINSYLYDNEHPIAVKGIQPVEQNFRFGDKQTVVLWREYGVSLCDLR